MTPTLSAEALVQCLAAARIGTTFNQYRDERLAERLTRYLEARADAPILSSARRPVTAAHGSPASPSRRSASSPATGRARRARRSSTASSQTWRSRTTSCCGTSSRRTRHRDVEPAADAARDHCRAALRSELARGRRVLAVGRIAEARSKRRMSAIRRMAARPPSVRRLLRASARPRPRRPAQHLPARCDARRRLRRRAARRGRVLADLRPRHRRQGTPRARPRDLPRRRSVHRRGRRTRDGPVRTKARAGHRLHRRRLGLRAYRARDAHHVDHRRHRRLRAHGLVERNGAARPDCGRRHVPAAAARARDLVRPLRLRLRRDPGPDRLQPAVRRQAARGERVDGSLARRRRDQHGLGRDRLPCPPGHEEDRRAHHTRGSVRRATR